MTSLESEIPKFPKEQMEADRDMATDQSSTVMTTAPPVLPYKFQISNNSAVSRRIPRLVRVANPIGKTRFAREKQEMEEKLGILILTNEKNKEEENIASSSSSISAAKVEQGFDKEEELHSAKVEGFDKERPVAAPQRHPLALRQRRAARQDPVAVLHHRQRRQRKEAARQSLLNKLAADMVFYEATQRRLEAMIASDREFEAMIASDPTYKFQDDDLDE